MPDPTPTPAPEDAAARLRKIRERWPERRYALIGHNPTRWVVDALDGDIAWLLARVTNLERERDEARTAVEFAIVALDNPLITAGNGGYARIAQQLRAALGQGG